MNDHMEQITEIGARALHDVDPENSGETFENCCARAWEMRDARAVITAVLPHIRAMIAEENIALYEQAARIADEIAARIAERNQT